MELRELVDDIFYLPAVAETDRPAVVVIPGGRRTLLVDSGNSGAHALEIRRHLEALGREPDLIVLTHWHWDHTFGLHAFDCPAIAHEHTIVHLERMQGLRWDRESLEKRVAFGAECAFCAEKMQNEYRDPGDVTICLPEMRYRERFVFDTGKYTCEVVHFDSDHTDDASVVYIREPKILLPADILVPDIYSGPWRYTYEKTERLIGFLENFDADLVLESHREPVSGEVFREELREMRVINNLVNNHHAPDGDVFPLVAEALGRPLDEDDIERVGWFLNG